MADFCDDFENWIRSRPRITDLIGEGSACRCYPDVPNQGIQSPFLVYAETGGESEEHLAGPAGICKAVVMVWAYGETRRKANQLAEIVKEEIRPWKGSLGGTHVSEVSCSSHRQFGVDLPQDNSDTKRPWTSRVYDIWHQETT